MTALLARLLGRLPIGWLQLTYNRTRLIAAIAGVAFANILIFMQLGFLGALQSTTQMPYRVFDADLIISAADTNTLSDGGNVPRQRMLQALATAGVADAAPLYFGKVDWDQPNGDSVNLQIFGIDPRSARLNKKIGPDGKPIDAKELQLLDHAYIDSKSRNIEPEAFAMIDAGEPLSIELNGRTIELTGTFAVGAGFEADGYLIASDQTFQRLIPRRTAGAPSHILVKLEDGADTAAVQQSLRERLAGDVVIRPLEEAALADQRYQTTERPVGVVFGFGVVIGFLVGIVITYQVLSTDVADHIKEYATFKAMGYRQKFFLSVVFEEAFILAILGFIPGTLIAMVLYKLVAAATFLPLAMTALRPPGVLIATIVMCAVSGAIATRRLKHADPADLF